MLQSYNISCTLDPRQGPLFHHINLSVGDGEKVALIGRNGVGKTRLIRILAGLDPPSEGQWPVPQKTIHGDVMIRLFLKESEHVNQSKEI